MFVNPRRNKRSWVARGKVWEMLLKQDRLPTLGDHAGMLPRKGTASIDEAVVV